MHQWLLFIYLFGGFLVFFPTSLANKKKFQVNQFDDTGCKNRKFAVTVPRRWGHSQRPPPRPQAKRPEEPKLPTAAGRAQGLRVGPGLGRRHARSLRGRGPAGRAGSRSVPLRARRPFVGRRSGFPAFSGPGVARSLHLAGACRSLNHLQCRNRRRARSCHREGAASGPRRPRPRPRSVRTAGRPRTRAAQVGQRDPPQARSCGRGARPSGPESPARGSVPGARAAGAARPRELRPWLRQVGPAVASRCRKAERRDEGPFVVKGKHRSLR